MRQYSIIAIFVSLLIAAPWSAAGEIPMPIGTPQPAAERRFVDDLKGPWQLFIDDHLVASKKNLLRRYHPFQKDRRSPLIKVDRPWEENVINAMTVIADEDGNGLRMYYYCWTKKGDPNRSYCCYATSKDGLTWEKPNLGLFEWKGEGPGSGTKNNNIIPDGPSHIMFTPWEKDPQKRYQAVGDMYHAYSSPDGLRWKKESKETIVSGGDTSHFYWDTHTKRFRGHVKGGATGKVSSDVVGMSRRVVGFSETDDLTKFPPLRIVMAPDDFDDRWAKPDTVQRTHFYACPSAPYETMYIGLLQIYRAEEQWGYFHGPLWLELVSSRDGVHWLREEGDRPPLIDIGKFRTFDHGMVIAPPPIRVGDELWTYYTGYDEEHDLLPYHSAIGLARMRKDGFASLDADEVPGELVTRRFADVSGPLMVNAACGNGSIRVELLDAAGRVLSGYERDACEPLSGNSVRQAVTWKAKKELPTDRGPVRFRFLLERAQLYSFMPGEKARVLDEDPKPPLAALYTFEGEVDPWSDMLGDDGLQLLRNLGTSYIDDRKAPAGPPTKPDPAFGKRSLIVDSVFRPWNRLEIDGTSDLGRHFTLAAMVKSTGKKLARLFSAYQGNFPVSTSELIFDFDPTGRVVSGLRLCCKGFSIESDDVTFDDGKYHHLAVVYDDGQVSFYLDGKPAGRQWIPGGEPVKLARNLHVGEDANRGSDEQLRGRVDDVLVLGRALSEEEIAALARTGAAAFFKLGQ